MKKTLITALLSFGTCLSAFASSITYPIAQSVERPCHDLKVVNVLTLTEQDLNVLMRGECPEIAIEFSANTTLPLHLFLKGDLVSLIGDKSQQTTQLDVKQTFYVRCVSEGFILSSNLTEWKTLSEFITGTLSIGLNIQNDQAFVTFGSEGNLRS